MEDEKKFAEQMLGATFEFAKLAVSSLILLNAGAATAVLAFLGTHGEALAHGKLSVLFFTFGAGLGGVASALAYLGQRGDWEVATGRRKKTRWVSGLIWAAIACLTFGYALFFVGSGVAATAIARFDKSNSTVATPVISHQDHK
jgi:hypothetical protein